MRKIALVVVAVGVVVLGLFGTIALVVGLLQGGHRIAGFIIAISALATLYVAEFASGFPTALGESLGGGRITTRLCWAVALLPPPGIGLLAATILWPDRKKADRGA